MSDICIPTSAPLKISINTAIHVFILFTFLGMFFMFFVSGYLNKVISEQLADMVDNSFGDAIDGLPQDEKMKLRLAMSNIDIDNLINVYSKPHDAVIFYNHWLFNAIWIIIIALFLFILSIIGTYAMLCGTAVAKPVAMIILENILTFIFIAIVEAAFFWFIVTKYIPAPPSYMKAAILDSLKKYL